MSRKVREWLLASESSELLGVRRETLYAYVSRGKVRTRREAGKSVYSRADLEALKTRSLARRGHTAVAAGALRFGEPVLDTRVSALSEQGPIYRGMSALELYRQGVSVERVAELLWSGELPPDEPRWPPVSTRSLANVTARKGQSSTEKMLLVLASLPAEGDAPWQRSTSEELPGARRLMRLLAAAPALGDTRTLAASLAAPSLSAALLLALGRGQNQRAETLMNGALTLIADHELNASTFVARVAASAGADLPRALAAAFATLSGGRHGGVCDRLDALLDGFAAPEDALGWVRDELLRREAVVGFGHPLYPAGDPRAEPLLAASYATKKNDARVRSVRVACEAMQLGGGEPPSVDLALVALAAALGLPRGGASAIFALGRAVGYVAHALEQREQGFLLRPRAHYVGV